MKITQKELMSRAKSNQGAPGAFLSDLGCEALLNVIEGNLEPAEALSALKKMRDVVLDRDGDLNDPHTMQSYCEDKGWGKDTDFGWYSTGEYDVRG